MKLCRGCDTTKPLADFPKNQSRCRVCRRAAQAAYAKTPKGREVQRRSSRKMRLRHAYGITPEQFDQMVEQQGGKCGICGGEEPLCVDHDHDTGAIRGLLCSRCNRAIGLLGDDLPSLTAAVTYLEQAADTAPLT